MKNRMLIPMLVLLIASAAALPRACGAVNLLVNGNFESQPNWGRGVSGNGGYTAFVGNQIPGWTIETNHAVTIHVSPGPYLVISNAYSANMDGEGYNGRNANLYQDFASAQDLNYSFSFDWQSWSLDAPPTTNALKVSVTDTVTSNVVFVGFYYHDGNRPRPVHRVTTNFMGTGNSLRLRIQESPESRYNDNSFVVDNFSVIAGPPRLGIAVAAPSQVALSWPTNSSGYSLERTLSLSVPAWNTVTNVPVIFGNRFQVTVPTTNAQQFFRLRQP